MSTIMSCLDKIVTTDHPITFFINSNLYKVLLICSMGPLGIFKMCDTCSIWFWFSKLYDIQEFMVLGFGLDSSPHKDPIMPTSDRPIGLLLLYMCLFFALFI